MAPTPIVASQDGPRLTVALMMKSPTTIPRRVIRMTDQQFIVDSVLRNSGSNNGSVMYWESTPLFTEEDPQVMDEFGRIPVVNGSTGTPLVVRSVRRAMAIRVSKQMIDRNSVDLVNTQLLQVRNTMVRAWEDALFSAVVANPSIQVVATDTAWGAAGSHIRKDVNAAKYVIKNASADDDGKQKFGYVADTLIISTETENDFMDSDEVSKVYNGNLASKNIQYTGLLPNKFSALDVLVSWRLSAYMPSCAMVLQRKVAGGISDERSLSATPMYAEGGGGNGGPTESFRSDTTRASAVYLDQPKAICVIAGVNGGSGTFSGGNSGDGLAYDAGTAESYPSDGEYTTPQS